MSELVRFGVSLEKELLKKFDRYIKKRKYTNRSEAIRDLIRESFVEQKWNDNDHVAGVITIVYDHHQRELLNKIMDVQHDFHHVIISTQHIHVGHHNCFEMIAVRGEAAHIQALSDQLRSSRGIQHTTLSITGIA